MNKARRLRENKREVSGDVHKQINKEKRKGEEKEEQGVVCGKMNKEERKGNNVRLNVKNM